MLGPERSGRASSGILELRTLTHLRLLDFVDAILTIQLNFLLLF